MGSRAAAAFAPSAGYLVLARAVLGFFGAAGLSAEQLTQRRVAVAGAVGEDSGRVVGERGDTLEIKTAETDAMTKVKAAETDATVKVKTAKGELPIGLVVKGQTDH